MVIYFAGFQHHYSIYPATAQVLGALEEELAGHVHSKATIRFRYDEPIPTRLITRIAKLRAAEVAERKAEKATKKKATVKKAKPKKAEPKKAAAKKARPKKAATKKASDRA